MWVKEEFLVFQQHSRAYIGVRLAQDRARKHHTNGKQIQKSQKHGRALSSPPQNHKKEKVMTDCQIMLRTRAHNMCLYEKSLGDLGKNNYTFKLPYRRPCQLYKTCSNGTKHECLSVIKTLLQCFRLWLTRAQTKSIAMLVKINQQTGRHWRKSVGLANGVNAVTVVGQ